ncbi:MAG: selenocysteine-specific translation elongation factor [Chloroflexota bacterium]
MTQMYVLGTAGHIDHGKSVLVHTLTGIDPDRLREEKERGMTIDLGFAWLKLPSGREVGIVDVPGHERFVKNMLAGVGGIDLAMLIIAANEGVMPQTREHLAILDLLQVKSGIVVITKKDLVDEELLTLVRMEVEEIIGNTSLSGAPVVAVSALTGEGMPELLTTIDKLLDTTEPRPDRARPRLPVDRVFTITGAGTIVTGTLIDGSLAVGQEVEIVPAGLKSRVRGLQTHKTKEETASPGSRVAVNLVGVNTAQVRRGDVITRPGWLRPTSLISGKLRLLEYLSRPLRHNTTVSLHTGAAEVMAKVRLLEAEELKPGDTGWAQFGLEEPLAVVEGDYFIVRSPMETLGGGRVAEAHTRRLRRFRRDVVENLEARQQGSGQETLLALLAGNQPVEMAALRQQSNLADAAFTESLEALVQAGDVISVSEGKNTRLYNRGNWERLASQANSVLTDYHRRFPMRGGMPRVELGSRLKLGAMTNAVLQRLSGEEGGPVLTGGAVHLPDHEVRLTPAQQQKVKVFLDSLKQNPYSPPAEHIPEPDLLNLLVEQGEVVKMSENIVFTAAVYREMVARVKEYLREHGKVSLGEVRDMFQTSRKYTQALLDYLDGEKITRRVGDDRVLL